jgi:hypothetical protein
VELVELGLLVRPFSAGHTGQDGNTGAGSGHLARSHNQLAVNHRKKILKLKNNFSINVLLIFLNFN